MEKIGRKSYLEKKWIISHFSLWRNNRLYLIYRQILMAKACHLFYTENRNLFHGNRILYRVSKPILTFEIRLKFGYKTFLL